MITKEDIKKISKLLCEDAELLQIIWSCIEYGRKLSSLEFEKALNDIIED
jgi:hypothetical protein